MAKRTVPPHSLLHPNTLSHGLASRDCGEILFRSKRACLLLSPACYLPFKIPVFLLAADSACFLCFSCLTGPCLFTFLERHISSQGCYVPSDLPANSYLLINSFHSPDLNKNKRSWLLSQCSKSPFVFGTSWCNHHVIV